MEDEELESDHGELEDEVEDENEVCQSCHNYCRQESKNRLALWCLILWFLYYLNMVVLQVLKSPILPHFIHLSPLNLIKQLLNSSFQTEGDPFSNSFYYSLYLVFRSKKKRKKKNLK